MKIKIHKQDMADLTNLDAARRKVKSDYPYIKAGSLKQRDVTIFWKDLDAFITVSSRDITIPKGRR